MRTSPLRGRALTKGYAHVVTTPRWMASILLVAALGVLAIAIQEWRDDDSGEAFTWALLSVIVGGRGIWMLWRGRSRKPDAPS
jgi:hypothetical protein